MSSWEIISRLWRFQNAAFELARGEFTDLGLEPKALAILCLVPHLRHPNELARAFSMPAPTMSHYIRQMEQGGLVRREIDPADRRRFLLTLTPEGEAQMHRGQQAIETVLGERLRSLTTAERETLGRTLDLLDDLVPNPVLDPILRRANG